MATKGSKTTQHEQVTEAPRVWTLVVTGGSPFQLRLPANPLLEHEGTCTVWKMYGTLSEVQAVASTVQTTSGAYVKYLTEEQTAEQLYERMELLGLEPTERVEPLPDDPSEVLTEIASWKNNPPR